MDQIDGKSGHQSRPATLREFVSLVLYLSAFVGFVVLGFWLAFQSANPRLFVTMCVGALYLVWISLFLWCLFFGRQKTSTLAYVLSFAFSTTLFFTVGRAVWNYNPSAAPPQTQQQSDDQGVNGSS